MKLDFWKLKAVLLIIFFLLGGSCSWADIAWSEEVENNRVLSIELICSFDIKRSKSKHYAHQFALTEPTSQISPLPSIFLVASVAVSLGCRFGVVKVLPRIRSWSLLGFMCLDLYIYIAILQITINCISLLGIEANSCLDLQKAAQACVQEIAWLQILNEWGHGFVWKF